MKLNITKLLIMVLLLASIFFISGCQSRIDYEKGYDAGMGDAVKDQYWIDQRRQKEAKKSNYKIRYYQFDAPKNVDGVKYVPHKITVRSIEI